MKEAIPTFRDISPTEGLDLDEMKSVEIFLGRNSSQAKAIFADNPTHYADYLLHMGPVAFSFYFDAYIDFIIEQNQFSDEDCMRDLLMILDQKSKDLNSNLAKVKSLASIVVNKSLEPENESRLSHNLRMRLQKWRQNHFVNE